MTGVQTCALPILNDFSSSIHSTGRSLVEIEVCDQNKLLVYKFWYVLKNQSVMVTSSVSCRGEWGKLGHFLVFWS